MYNLSFLILKKASESAASMDFAGDEADADAASESSSVPSSEFGRTLLPQCNPYPPNQDNMDLFFAQREAMS